tara:strand:- start:48 stop:398 length:351 start_codon:yes stop_codon:yes gene_type:complete
MNRVELTGQYYPNDSKGSAHKFSVRQSFKKDGEWENEYYDCVAFGKTAEFIQQYWKKGQAIEVSGRLTKSTWTNNEGQKRSKVEIVCDRPDFPPKDSKNMDKDPADPTESWDPFGD